jgi:GDP-L-fucose synthase
MSKILVTGSKGLLGSALVKQIKSNGDIAIEHDRQLANLLNNDKTERFINEHKPDTIIHCAAKVGGVLANMNNNDVFFTENIKLNSNILETAFYHNVDNFVSILSTCIFPNEGITYPLTADQLDLGKPHPSNIGYSYAKRLLYYQTKMYRNYTGKNWISVIPTNIYGENDYFNLENSHLIPALIRKAYEASITNEPFIVWGDGTPLRQFIYSEDLSKLILWAIENWKSEQPFMAINETEYSIKDVALIIADRFNVLNKITFDESKPKGQFRKPAKSDFKYYSFTPIEEGLNKTIDWFIANYDNIRK